MQLNAKECHTKALSMTVDGGLVEVDRRESRLLDWSCGWSRGGGVRGGGDRRRLRKRVCRTQRCWQNVNVVHDDLNRREFVGPLALVVSEDECNGAILQ